MVNLTVILAPMLMVIGLGVGSTLTTAAFRQVWTDKKRAVICGFVSQFLFMPWAAWTAANLAGLSDLQAVGLVLVGASPGGVSSNLFTYWSKGEVVLSVIMSVVSTVCALFMMPLAVLVYIESTFSSDQITIDYLSIALGLLLITIPVGIGVWVRHYNTTYTCGNRKVHQWVEICGSVIGGIFLIAAVVFGIADNHDLFSESWEVWIISALMEPVGALFGYTLAMAMRLSQRDRATICLETGVQNSSLTIAIVALSYDDSPKEVRREVLVFPLMYSLWFCINSVWLVLLLRYMNKGLGEVEVLGIPDDAASSDDAFANDLVDGSLEDAIPLDFKRGGDDDGDPDDVDLIVDD